MTDPAVAALAALARRQESLATAESLTGGLIGAHLTAVPGASASYRGGLVTYATDLKQSLADVTPETLATHGPVSAATAVEMAAGVRRRLGADWGLAVTGVAGPDPQDGHPVGQVFVAVRGPRTQHAVVELRLGGDRESIRRATVERALRALTDLVDRD